MSVSSSELSYNLNSNKKKLSKVTDSNEMNDDFYGEYYLDDGNLKKQNGLHWMVATFFIVADMAGLGIIALPKTIITSGFYPGVFLIIFMAVIGAASAIVMGKTWVIMLRMFPIYRTHCRQPYSEMGYRACGKKMRTIVSFFLNITQFAIGTTFLLLTSESIVNFIFNEKENTMNDICITILIITALLIPVVLFKSPNDFWPIVVISMLSTLIAVIFICIGTYSDFKEPKFYTIKEITIEKILLSLGTILFTFGGHSALPTVQHDMQNPKEFLKSSTLAFMIIALMNLTVVIIGAATYGDYIDDMIVKSIKNSNITKIINAFIIMHCLFVFPFMINPLNQEVEEIFGISHKFGIKRVIVRLFLLFSMSFVALTIPKFDVVMNLLGASTLTITSLVFPPIFYLYLSGAEKYKREMVTMNTFRKIENEKQIIENCNKDYDPLLFSIGFKKMLKYSDKKMFCLCLIILTVGIIFGSIATEAAIEKMYKEFSNNELQPCYMGWFNKNSSHI